MTYTPEDYTKIKNLIGHFPAYLEVIGVQPHQPTMDLLLSEERQIRVDPEGTETVAGWVSWVSNFQQDRTTLWMSKLRGTALIHRDAIEAWQTLGKFQSGFTRESYGATHYDCGCRIIYRKACAEAGRGMSVTNMVVEGVDPESKLYRDIHSNLIPVWAYVSGASGKWITVY